MTAVQATINEAAQAAVIANKLNTAIDVDQKDLEEDAELDRKITSYLAKRGDCAMVGATEASQQAFDSFPKDSMNKAGCEKLIPRIFVLTAQQGDDSANMKYDAALPQEIDGTVMQFECEDMPDQIYIEEQSSKKIVFAAEGKKSVSCAVGEKWTTVIAYAYSKEHGLFKSEPIDLEDDDMSMADMEDFDAMQAQDEQCAAKEKQIAATGLAFKIEKAGDKIKISVPGAQSIWLRNQDGLLIGSAETNEAEFTFDAALTTSVKAFAHIDGKTGTFEQAW